MQEDSADLPVSASLGNQTAPPRDVDDAVHMLNAVNFTHEVAAGVLTVLVVAEWCKRLPALACRATR